MALPRSAVLTCLLAVPAFPATPLAGIPQATARLRVAARETGVPFPLQAPEVRVFKAAHRLELWASGRCVRTYRTGLSQRGLADKRVSGDHLTPEGRFYVCTRSSQSAFHLFLGLSYPDAGAAERGLWEGLITAPTRDAILAALRRKACPPWNTGLGGTVGLHGHGGGADWTWGCVAVEDVEVDELWAACPLGTPVVIAP